MGLFAEKHITIILDLGSATTKIGFACENGPRAITPSTVLDPETQRSVGVFDDMAEQVLRRRLALFVHKLFIKYLLVNPKERRFIVVENLLADKIIRETVAKVLFMHFQVPSVWLLSSHVASLACLAVSDGLVLDIGHREASLIPIVAGVPILWSWGALPLGGSAIHASLKRLLMERGAITDHQGRDRSLGQEDLPLLSPSVLEDILLSCCFVSSPERAARLARNLQDRSHEPPPPPPGVMYPVSGGAVLRIPGTVRELACEVLFQCDLDRLSLPHMVLRSVQDCNVDCRKPLASNLVVTGGGAMIQGLQHRLLQEIRLLAAAPPYAPLPPFRMHRLPVPANTAAWLGGCLMGSTESAVTGRSISKDQYSRLLQSNAPLPDWTSNRASQAAA